MYNEIKIFETPKIETKSHRKFLTEDKLLQEMIHKFIKVLEANLTQDNLKLLYNNISTLKIENKSIFFEIIQGLFKKNTITGYYFLDENIISVIPLKDKKIIHKILGASLKEYIINLYHELLHMSSTTIDKKNSIAFSGFSQITKDIGIGIALDDGYTEKLLYKYFDLDKEEMTYKYEILISELVEEIIAEEKMINYYFTANLYGLIEELKKYSAIDSIKKFLDDFDCIYTLQNYSNNYKKDIIYYHNEITDFLVRTYVNKIKLDLILYKITEEEYNIKLNKYLDKIHLSFELLEVDNKTKKK